MPGAVRTRVGYAGGSKRDPTYHDLGDHSETTQVDYDPQRLSYQQLLDVFWEAHSPTRRAWSRQYASIIFYHSDEQKRLALAGKEQQEARLGSTIHTEMVPYKEFYLAEDYHQKYYLRNTPELLEEFEAMYANDCDIVNSTAAARVNGYVGGYGNLEDLQQELSSYGLSPQANKVLLAYARTAHRRC